MNAMTGTIEVFRQAMREDKARRAEKRQKFESTEFLPAALEVVESPPSPIGRGLLMAIGVNSNVDTSTLADLADTLYRTISAP